MAPTRNGILAQGFDRELPPAEAHRGPLKYLPSDAFRNHLIAGLGEYIGTFMFLLLAFSGAHVANTVASVSDVQRLMFISLAFGFSLAVNAWVFYRISGGVSLALITHWQACD